MDSDLQRSYQSGLTHGMLVSIGLAVLVGIFIKLQDHGKPVQPDEPTHRSSERIQQAMLGQDGNGRRAAVRGFNGGFVKINIISDDGPVVGKKHITTPVKHISYAEIAPEVTDTIPGIGDDNGIGSGERDYGLPDFPSPRPPVVFLQMPALAMDQRNVKVRKSDRKLWISKVNVFTPRKAQNVKGSATVELVVSEKGLVTRLDVLDEQPCGFGFGQALKDALNECFYEPAIINGVETAVTITLTYEFDFSKPPMLETSGNVLVDIQ